MALRLGLRTIAYGMNRDDRGDWRPGRKAARERGVRAPLDEADLGKDEVRALAQYLGLSVWDKPAEACYSSRIPYGAPVTREALLRVGRAERALRALGFRQARVRHHDDVARIEIDPAEFARLLDTRPARGDHPRRARRRVYLCRAGPTRVSLRLAQRGAAAARRQECRSWGVDLEEPTGWRIAVSLRLERNTHAAMLVAFQAGDHHLEETLCARGSLGARLDHQLHSRTRCVCKTWYFFLKQVLQRVMGYSPVLTGIAFLPMTSRSSPSHPSFTARSRG